MIGVNTLDVSYEIQILSHVLHARRTMLYTLTVVLIFKFGAVIRSVMNDEVVKNRDRESRSHWVCGCGRKMLSMTKLMMHISSREGPFLKFKLICTWIVHHEIFMK